MKNKSHSAILKIAKKEALSRGYKGQIKLYRVNMEGKSSIEVQMQDGRSFSFAGALLNDDADFKRAAEDTRRLR